MVVSRTPSKSPIGTRGEFAWTRHVHSHEELLANVYRKQGERIAYELAPDSAEVKDLAG
jgi:hypothetical protein